MLLEHTTDKSYDADIILVGWGIMSGTLWVLLKKLQPDLSIVVLERSYAVGYESSDTLNNAGTWHSAFCELNYTPEKPDGTIDITKANAIVEKFELSKQRRAYMVEQWHFDDGASFINQVPHMSLVFGESNRIFLKKRFEAMQSNHLFHGMQYSQDTKVLQKWFPLAMRWRSHTDVISATRMNIGVDVNFWILTRNLFQYLENYNDVDILLNHEVTNLMQLQDGAREVAINNRNSVGTVKSTMKAQHVFLGSWWMAIPLLAKSGIPEWKWYGWFPVDGQRLICTNKKIIDQHQGKVYGKASVWSPPMSVPHLDTRYVNGKKSLIFGPYAGFTTKFLKQWSRTDLFRSLTRSNLIPMIATGIRNRSLTQYLVREVTQSWKSRFDALRAYYPEADEKDRYCAYAGKRVQIIKKDKKKWWVLQFGTEVVVSADKTISALLWASPWASTTVSIMLELLEKAFPKQMKSTQRQTILKEMMPSFGSYMRDNIWLTKKIRAYTHKVLWITDDDS